MKLAVRVFALLVVVAGAAAAVKSPAAPNTAVTSHQSATATLPVPVCGPNTPMCPTLPGPTVR